jgi:cytochrome c553
MVEEAAQASAPRTTTVGLLSAQKNSDAAGTCGGCGGDHGEEAKTGATER